MNKIETVEDLTEIEIDVLFRERAMDALGSMEIPRFRDDGLVLARSEKEIAKCMKLAEKAEHKKEIRKRDVEGRDTKAQKRKETSSKAQKTNGIKKMKRETSGKHRKPFSKKDSGKKLK